MPEPTPNGQLVIRGQFRDSNALACPWVISALKTYNQHKINIHREITLTDERNGLNYRSQSFEQFTPDEARELAAALMKAADHAESGMAK
jgi:hypothetical protein